MTIGTGRQASNQVAGCWLAAGWLLAGCWLAVATRPAVPGLTLPTLRGRDVAVWQRRLRDGAETEFALQRQRGPSGTPQVVLRRPLCAAYEHTSDSLKSLLVPLLLVGDAHAADLNTDPKKYSGKVKAGSFVSRRSIPRVRTK